MKRTAAIACALLFLATFLPGAALYAAATCQRPCHSAAPSCPQHARLPGLSVPCSCGHDRDYRFSGRLENEVQPTSMPVAAVAVLTNEADGLPADPALSVPFSDSPRLSLICLTRSYRI